MDPLSSVSLSSAALSLPLGTDAVRRSATWSSAEGKTSSSAPASASETQKAARQFEAILVRQMLSESLKPVVSGGISGGFSMGEGGGAPMYGFLFVDALANALTARGGLGLATVLEKQLSPAPATDGARPHVP